MNLIQIIGLIVVLAYLIFGLDDLLWDVVCLCRRWWRYSINLPPEAIDLIPPKILAVAIGAWHEAEVIESTVTNFINATQYPIEYYHLFIGVYRNDSYTIDAVRNLTRKFKNVHIVYNPKLGPTSKAQNLNCIINYIKAYEKSEHLTFASITIHDSEDAVHPYELKCTNYFIDKYDAIQFPVFPIIEMPKFSNFFRQLTVATYADEFCENHFRMLRMREYMHAVIPSAGTGFALSRKVFTAFKNEPLLAEGSLTEDYKLSITLAERGFGIHYIIERVPRILRNGKIHWDYIAVRSLFPKTFQAAVKQRTRWIYGITMQSVKLSEIIFNPNLNLASKYSIYKDQKAKIGNLILLPGYAVFGYFLLSLSVKSLPPIFLDYGFAWWCSVLLSFLTVYRQILRMLAINGVYGARSVFFACLLPPLIPIRLIWGNLINITATIRAYQTRLSQSINLKRSNPKSVSWAKTDHEFLSKTTLQSYHRRLGDELLRCQFITPKKLKEALEKKGDLSLGKYLIYKELITERQLVTALNISENKKPLSNLRCVDKGLRTLSVCPVYYDQSKIIFAIDFMINPYALQQVIGLLFDQVDYFYLTKEEIKNIP